MGNNFNRNKIWQMNLICFLFQFLPHNSIDLGTPVGLRFLFIHLHMDRCVAPVLPPLGETDINLHAIR